MDREYPILIPVPTAGEPSNKQASIHLHHWHRRGYSFSFFLHGSKFQIPVWPGSNWNSFAPDLFWLEIISFAAFSSIPEGESSVNIYINEMSYLSLCGRHSKSVLHSSFVHVVSFFPYCLSISFFRTKHLHQQGTFTNMVSYLFFVFMGKYWFWISMETGNSLFEKYNVFKLIGSNPIGNEIEYGRTGSSTEFQCQETTGLLGNEDIQQHKP